MKNINLSLIFKFFLLLTLVASCTPMKKITYMNNSHTDEWDISPIPPKHHLEIGDILMVKVISRNEEVNKLFNIETNTNSANLATTATNLYLNGFSISQDGNIDLPNVGKVFLLNQTLEEAKETIESKANELLINPFVVVKLANFEFTVLGEVNQPGNYPVAKEDITIFEALAMAGDINDYGNLKKVKVIRSNKNKKQIHFLDLTDSNILSSEFYYLHNNDLVYVQPLRFKGFKKSQSQVLLSTLTTIAVIMNLYLKFNE